MLAFGNLITDQVHRIFLPLENISFVVFPQEQQQQQQQQQKGATKI